MMPPTATRFCGLALCHIAIAAAGRPNILKRKAPARIPAVGSPAKKAVDVAVHDRPARLRVSTHLEEERHVPDVVQTERDQQPLDEAVDGRAVRGLETAAQCENVSMPCCIGGQIADSTTPAMPRRAR